MGRTWTILAVSLLLCGCNPADEDGCPDGACLCTGVICDQPPADACVDADTLQAFESVGQCQQATGLCEYESAERDCPGGCADGRCLGGKPVWGWITLLQLENPNSFMNGPDFWRSGLRAVFMEQAHWTRVHEQQYPSQCGLVLSEGACSLYACQEKIPFWMCTPSCDPRRQECLDQAGQFTCSDLPAHWDMGTLSVEGLAQPISFVRQENNLYAAEPPAGDLFSMGDPVEVTGSGGELQPFSLSASGTAPLAVASNVVDVIRGRSAVVEWVPEDPGASIQVLLEAGHHYPFLADAIISCDASDSAGRVEVPAALVEGFLDRTLVTTRYSFLIRYRRAAITGPDLSIELVVGRAQNLSLNTD
jgi:hypothetical protein